MSQTIDDPDPYMTDDGLIDIIHTPNGGDDYDIEPRMPNSWVDEFKTRHCIVWDLDQEIRYRWDDESDRMVPDIGIF